LDGIISWVLILKGKLLPRLGHLYCNRPTGLGAFNFQPQISYTKEMSRHLYMIVIQDSSTDVYTYGIPNIPDIPVQAFVSYTDAKKFLMEIIESFPAFTPVAYGEAYPYEKTTFDNEIDTNDFALAGWITAEDDEETDRIPIGMLKIPIEGSQQAS